MVISEVGKCSLDEQTVPQREIIVKKTQQGSKPEAMERE